TYFEGTAARLCSEGPVPVVRKTSEQRVPGGAANTAANLHALDADVQFLSIIGRDSAGAFLRTALEERGVNTSKLVEDATASTLHKMRILADGQYVVRFDDEVPSSYTAESTQQLLALLEQYFSSCDLVIISDYAYSVISDEMIEHLRILQAQHPKVLLIDSKDLYRFRNVGATVITPNLLEARLFVEHRTTSLHTEVQHSEIEHIAQHMLTVLGCEHVAITMGSDGVFLLDQQDNSQHLPAHPIAQANDIGAGDSFAAAMALALAAGGSIEEAARIGIDAASIALAKRGTAIVQHQELLQQVSLQDYALYGRQTTDTAWDVPLTLSQLTRRLEQERAAGRTIVFTNGVFDILHAGHVHFLRQAKDLGDLLVVGVNSDSSTRRLKGKNRPINSERDRVALVAALDPVDYVIVFDEDTPTELLRILQPAIHVKGGVYANEVLPEAEAVQEGGGRIVILPLAGNMSTSSVIDRIVALSSSLGSGGSA
ncbi:MAG: D-glycero-beta-D-manno-heptose 1-phosphate adenylyltransferase, partial [Chloroflexota bacterium]|nr:D-glycero-beta-D-manno-heptose 1-phosphate adenylyltransferase [Chloroflexota bacterium]